MSVGAASLRVGINAHATKMGTRMNAARFSGGFSRLVIQ